MTRRSPSGPGAEPSLLRRGAFTTGLLILGVAVSGTKACQEDYDLGSKTAKATATPTATQTSTATQTGGSTITPIGTQTPESSPSASPSPSPSTSPSVTVSPTAALSKSLKQDLASLSAPAPSNWLGQAFTKDKRPPNSSDLDGDGYTDRYEEDAGTDPGDGSSTPPPPSTKLLGRFAGVDDDMDGAPNGDEGEIGTDPAFHDSDRDGCLDGIELREGTDPLDSKNLPEDLDGDCLDADEETILRADVRRIDSDGDGLTDSTELVLGTSATSPDSDGDGILDGREVELGGDPAQAEPR